MRSDPLTHDMPVLQSYISQDIKISDRVFQPDFSPEFFTHRVSIEPKLYPMHPNKIHHYATAKSARLKSCLRQRCCLAVKRRISRQRCSSSQLGIEL
jgi:hypothetical protein